MQFQIPETISDEIFAILTREENEMLIDRIVDEHQIREDQVSHLSAVIGFAIMGTIQLTDLATALAEELDIGLTEAKRVALSVLLNIIYPFWPLFFDIDEVIKNLGGEVPKEKPAMPRQTNNQQPTPNQSKLGTGQATSDEIVVTYPSADLSKEPEKPELLGGMEIPVPPAPATANRQPPTSNRVLERDVPWMPMGRTNNESRVTNDGLGSRNIAKPGDVSKLLEKNLIQKRQDAEPRVKGNVVDLSG